MDVAHIPGPALSLLPPLAMGLAAALALPRRTTVAAGWRRFQVLCGLAFAATVLALLAGPVRLQGVPGLQPTVFGLVLALLVQGLGLVIAAFSARYLEGEAGQRRYAAALGVVLAAVHLLLMADHWLVLIGAWAAVGAALQRLLCFYPDRPFALLAAHKKRIADRAADGLLLLAAGLAWHEVGSGSLSALWAHLAQQGPSAPLQWAAVALVLAVVLRTALLPVHGWLIQVMEAPTPVSALLHAGVVNLGGFVLIRFAPLLDAAAPARWLLLGFGLATAVLAGLVMLTRISIKVRLAWSTVAQMGFMLLECAVGLYTLAALHLLGHSLYKAHAFLSASGVVREARRQALHAPAVPQPFSLPLAPVLGIGTVLLVLAAVGGPAWPLWWSALLGLAWAPMLWLPAAGGRLRGLLWGLLMIAGLTLAVRLVHALPLGLHDAPQALQGAVALLGMALLYVALAALQWRPQALARARRWSYAGFYVDEVYTRLALRLWPAHWMPEARRRTQAGGAPAALADAAQ
ncbi:NADH-quinone oxidoreductase subunit L [Pseudacidovorax intermedius]|uniref:Probable inorganic carbon transporter subunit DabB n=1 Tax=Pseudacidovorax intermedius TaxID=433924 RepID=A0A147GPZ9_9BURK|nr:NADH-quinone oxidoreductase subunit L [Pseudacidovorax intermedius]KTT17191.1 NADH dehydrogenase [Pseudacidovorax intermedius]